MSVTRAWKVFGATGHRQRESFGRSYVHDWSDNKSGTRHITVLREDITKTNDYVIVIITSDTADKCEEELEGQISDGIFENSRVGNVTEIELCYAREE